MNAGHDYRPSAAAAANQCAIVLARLREGPATTSQLRTILGLSSSPAARILQLRHAGHLISTMRTTIGGATVACYVLEDGAKP